MLIAVIHITNLVEDNCRAEVQDLILNNATKPMIKLEGESTFLNNLD